MELRDSLVHDCGWGAGMGVCVQTAAVARVVDGQVLDCVCVCVCALMFLSVSVMFLSDSAMSTARSWTVCFDVPV